MKSLYYFAFLFFIMFISCIPDDKVAFDDAALDQPVYNIDMESTSVRDVLAAHRGEKVLIGLWASWCMDCVKSLPNVVELQKEYPDLNFVFLSVDEDQEKWQEGVSKYMQKFKVKGEQYFFDTGWTKEGNNAFVDYIGLDWIPRYMLVDESGAISVYYSKKIKSKSIKEQLEK